MSVNGRVQVDVLIVGCGPAGLTAAIALAQQGVSVLAITKHRQLAPTPRAHVTNQRTFEVFRDLGFENEARRFATGYDRMPYGVFLRTLVGMEFGRILALGEEVVAQEFSPCRLADLPQNLLEPVLLQAALRAGAQVRFSAELTSFEQDDRKVTAQIADSFAGEPVTVVSRYMIGADGGNSRVASALGLPFEGPGEIGRSLNVLFDCDLTQYVAHRPGLLYPLIRTRDDPDGPGIGMLRCIKPWTSWMLIQGFAAGREVPDLSVEAATALVRDYLGIPDLQLRVTGVDPWTMNALYATYYQRGRVFCMGDAVHRHVPLNGLGSNTAVQDAYNLAWKLAFVLKGLAGPDLLTSYTDERAPVGKGVVEHSTGALQLYADLLNAVGAPQASDAATMESQITAPSAAGKARRDAIRSAIGEMTHEFQTRGLELNQLYRSSAIISDGDPRNDTAELDLTPRVTTCPGTHLAHAWVERDRSRISTLDLVGRGRFTLLTGPSGTPWLAAAKQVSSQAGIEIAAVAIGPGCAVTDPLFEWRDRCEISDDGCLLVRPDGYVAWRQSRGSENADALLAAAINSIMCR